MIIWQDTGEIMDCLTFNIPYNEIDEFNKAIKEYTRFAKFVPNTWELVQRCFKNGHLRVPTLEELKSVPELEEDDNRYIVLGVKKRKVSSTGDSITLIICVIIPIIVLIMWFVY